MPVDIIGFIASTIHPTIFIDMIGHSSLLPHCLIPTFPSSQPVATQPITPHITTQLSHITAQLTHMSTQLSHITAQLYSLALVYIAGVLGMSFPHWIAHSLRSPGMLVIGLTYIYWIAHSLRSPGLDCDSARLPGH